MREFLIRGEKNAILTAQNLIGELLDRSQSVQDATRGAESTVSLAIEGRLIGLIMGKGGATIREIQDVSRANVTLIRDKGKGVWTRTLMGPCLLRLTSESAPFASWTGHRQQDCGQ